jgi:hypothetical protein
MASMTETTPAGPGPAALPADSHVHTQWSWDAVAGSMEDTCQRAAAIGLPAVAFTEHADFTSWLLEPGERIRDHWRALVSGGVLTPPRLVNAAATALLSRYPEAAPAGPARGHALLIGTRGDGTEADAPDDTVQHLADLGHPAAPSDDSS